MQIVIDIPEYLYKAIQSYKTPTEEEKAIANGTPLDEVKSEIEKDYQKRLDDHQRWLMDEEEQKE